MKKYLYFQTSSAIEGTDSSEEAIMVPADALIAIEPNNTTEVSMIFAGNGVGNIGNTDAQAKDVITVQLSVAAADFQEFCRQISKFINADVLNKDNSAYSKDGMLVVASSESGATSYFHSSVTGCLSIVIASGTA